MVAWLGCSMDDGGRSEGRGASKGMASADPVTQLLPIVCPHDVVT